MPSDMQWPPPGPGPARAGCPALARSARAGRQRGVQKEAPRVAPEQRGADLLPGSRPLTGAQRESAPARPTPRPDPVLGELPEPF